VLIDHPDRLDGVIAIGVDEHVWRHTRRGDSGEETRHRTPTDHQTRPGRD